MSTTIIKNKATYLMCLVALMLTITSCEKQEADFFDETQNGVYFDEATVASLNFAHQIIDNPQTLPINVSMKLLGYLSKEKRTANLKTRPVDGYPEAEVILPEVTFSDNEYKKNFVIEAVRPTELDTEYAICVYVDANSPGALGAGIEGCNEFTIYVKEQYEQPAGWSDTDWSVGFLGYWSPEKHIFFANLLKDNNFATQENLTNLNTLAEYNQKAIAEIRRMRSENPEATIVEIPFNKECTYDKPTYWNEEHEKYLGAYNSTYFGDIASAIGANTINESELIADKDMLPELNKKAVLIMMKNYNQYFSSLAISTTNFIDTYWFPMFEDIEYDVIQPDCWTNYGAGGGEKPKKYYGEYSKEKYRFMIKTWLKKQKAEGKQFMLWQMFPLIINWNTWDADWDQKAGGEDAMKECYKAFKAAYEAAPSGTYNFTFPNLDIE